jgi:Helix-turn-helix domain
MTTPTIAPAADGPTSDLCLYEVPDIMRMLKMARSTVYEELAAGRLHSVPRGRRRLFTAAHIRDYIALLEHEAAGPVAA